MASKTPILDRISEIREICNDKGVRVRKLLEQCGWKYSSDNPCHFWMYEKKLPDGRTVLCDAGTATDIEEEICGEEEEEGS